MGLPVDDRFLAMQIELKREKDNILNQRKRLIQQFRIYAIEVLKNEKQIFKFSWKKINGNESLQFKDLNIGDDVVAIIYNFKFNPGTEIITDYKRLEFRGTKETNDFEEFIASSASIRRYIKPSLQFSKIGDYEQEQIVENIQKKVDEIVIKILKGELEYDDLRFKKLMATKSALQQELNRVNVRLKALELSNSIPNTAITSTDSNQKLV